MASKKAPTPLTLTAEVLSVSRESIKRGPDTRSYIATLRFTVPGEFTEEIQGASHLTGKDGEVFDTSEEPEKLTKGHFETGVVTLVRREITDARYYDPSPDDPTSFPLKGRTVTLKVER